MTSIGPMGGGGKVVGTDGGASGITVAVPPPVPKGLGLGINMGVSNLLLMVLL